MASPRLKDYRAKRDFARTSEPAGDAGAETGHRFVVHKHQATADHYDLRLELDGVLKSWAVPKGPSLDPAEKRLAVQTEDHPVAYIDFEGVIPEGEYGGGPMIVWDTGTWAPMGDADEHLAKGDLKFRLAGEKLSGGWMLVRLKPKPGEKKTNWLLFKERDQAADPATDILATRPESVKSGRRIEELAGPPPKPPARLRPVRLRPARLRPGALPGAVKAPLPARLAPQLAHPAETPPPGDGWLHEIKFDGYRTLARRDGEDVRLITRAGLDWTHRYGDLGDAVRALPCRSALIDGEIVVPDAGGVTRFALLQAALSAGAGNRLVFYAFDLLFLDGWDLTAVPLLKRKETLAKLLAGQPANAAIHFSDHVAGNAAAFFESVADSGLEGVVSKRADAPYTSGRSRAWVKAKAPLTADFVIAGFTRSAANGGLGALALASREDGDLVYRGKVGTGFDGATLAALLARLDDLPPGGTLADAPKDIVWVRPVLTARVRYSNLTANGAVRHAVFRGLREVPPMQTDAPPRKRLISDGDLANLWVTNPDRRLFGRNGPTKLDLAVYYAHVGDFMLPHILNRPVSLYRCPTGLAKDCFFQRHPFTGMPAGIARFEIEKTDGEDRTYIAIEDAKGYLALAQFGVVEMHAWGCRRDLIEKPDRVIFDLDPGEGIAWRDVVEAALHVRDALAGKGLVPFAKTTGGKGIHVVVPITRRLDWKAVHEATGALSAEIAATAPDTFTTTMGPANRKRRIFIDWHRNARSATAVAPYSLRARNNLPASAPMTWESLAAVDDPADLNYATLPEIVAASGDPWVEIEASARDLPVARHGKG